MNRNSEVALVVADAFVMFYDNLLGKWVASGASKSVTIAKIQLLQNVTSNQFRIFAWNPINKEVLVNSVLYHNLRYQKAHATFHEWRDADTQLVYGLHFADTKDATIFGDVISRVFKSLELIYQQCRELQAQIRATSSIDQCNQSLTSSDPVKFTNNNPFLQEQSGDPRKFEYSTNNVPKTNNSTKSDQTCQYAQIIRSEAISIAKPLSSNAAEKRSTSVSGTSGNDFSNSETELQSPHNYENINSILLKHSAMKSASLGPENVELGNRCQSSSDDSVRGLKRQPSSASSGYATVASMTDQYSPTPGFTSTFSLVAEGLNKCISESKAKTESCAGDYSMGTDGLNKGPTSQSNDLTNTDSTTSSFASQLQSMIQLRKVNQSTKNNDTTTKLSCLQNNSKFDNGSKGSDGISEAISKECPSFIDPRSNIAQRIPPDDIMSEMKLKLQRRKQLIDGHTDPNYSSSTDKSDVCSSSASDASSLVGNMDQTLDRKSSPNKFEESNCKTRVSEMSYDNKTLLEDDDGSSQLSEDLKDASCKKKRSTGDIIQSANASTVIASKHDLDRIKKEITDDLRKELVDAKRDVLNAIRLLRGV